MRQLGREILYLTYDRPTFCDNEKVCQNPLKNNFSLKGETNILSNQETSIFLLISYTFKFNHLLNVVNPHCNHLHLNDLLSVFILI